MYQLDLLLHAALCGVHKVFHALLLQNWKSNGVYADVPYIQVNGEAENKVGETKDIMSVMERCNT